MDDQAALFSLNDDIVDRVFSYSGNIRWGGLRPSNYTTTGLTPNNPINVDWQGGGSYRAGSTTLSSARRECYLYVEAGSYVDFTAPSVYAYSDGSILNFSGTIRFSLAAGWYNSTAFYSQEIVVGNGGWLVYPQRMAVLVDGEVVTSVSSTDNTGTFTLDYEYEMDSAVSEVGYRFYFDVTHSQYQNLDIENGINTRGLYYYLDDNGLVTFVEVEQYVPLFKEVITEVKQIPSTIYNFFFGDSGDDAASGFKSDVDSAVSSVDQVQQEIEEGLNKPEPDAIVPDIDDVVDQDAFVSYTNVFASVLQAGSLVADMMIIVCSFAFLSYVLFGKKG